MADPDVVNPQGANDPHLASAPAASSVGEVPQMDMERVLPRQQSTGMGRGIVQLGSPDVYVDAGAEQIIVQKGLPNVLMGNQPNFGQGFYVSKPGVDVSKTSSAADFIFNSNQNTFKIVKEGRALISFPGGGFSFGYIEHNLGFSPLPFAFLESANSTIGGAGTYIPLPTFINANVNTVNQTIDFSSYVFVITDEQKIYFVGGNATATSIDNRVISYYLLQESVNFTS